MDGLLAKTSGWETEKCLLFMLVFFFSHVFVLKVNLRTELFVGLDFGALGFL
jgi:hypothetical protein